MARYIDAEAFKRKLIDEKSFFPAIVATALEEMPEADVVGMKQIGIIRDDLKWWLETNTEKGVVYIPKSVVENMIAKMDGGKEE